MKKSEITYYREGKQWFLVWTDIFLPSLCWSKCTFSHERNSFHFLAYCTLERTSSTWGLEVVFAQHRWGCSPLPLRADLCPCRAGDVQGLEPGREGSMLSGSSGTRAPAYDLLRAACICLRAPVTSEQECKLHICLGFPWRSRWLCVTLEKQKCFLRWPNESFIGGWRKKIKQAFRHMVTVLCGMY